MMRFKIVLVILLTLFLLAFSVIANAQTRVPKIDIPFDTPTDTKVQIETLYSLDYLDRAEAAEKLGEIGEKAVAAVPFLLNLLRNGSVKKYEIPYIAEALGKIKDIRGVEPLVKVFNTYDSHRIRMAAALAIARIGTDRSFEMLTGAMKKNEEAAIALGLVGDERALEQLDIILTRNSPPENSEKTIEALVIIDNYGALEILVDALDSDYTDVRYFASIALGKKRESRAYKPLTKLLADDIYYYNLWQRRIDLTELLIEIGEPVVEPLIASFEYESAPALAYDVSYVLRRIGQRSLNYLLKALKHENPKIRAGAARTLVGIRGMIDMKPVRALLEDEDKNVRVNAAYTLVYRDHEWRESEKSKAVIADVISMLDDDSPGVNRMAEIILAEIGDETAVGPLIARMKRILASRGDGAPWKELYDRFKSVTTALGNIRDTQAVGPLIKAMKADWLCYTSLAAEALGNIGDKRAVEPMLEILKAENDGGDCSDHYKDSIALALGRIGDKRVIGPMIEELKDGFSLGIPTALSELTGEDFFDDYDAWKKWWEENKSKFE